MFQQLRVQHPNSIIKPAPREKAGEVVGDTPCLIQKSGLQVLRAGLHQAVVPAESHLAQAVFLTYLH